MGTALLKADSGIDTFPHQRLDRIGRPAAGPLGTAPNRGILIVDGDDLARVLLGAGLRQEGRTVWLARSGDEALELYRRHGSAIGLVLLAVRLSGLDGPQTLAALRRLDPGVRCCFLSGPLSEFTDAELLQLGDAAVLHKTYSPAEITLILLQLLGYSPTGRHKGDGGLAAVLRWLWGLEEFVPTKSSSDGRLPAPERQANPTRESLFSFLVGSPAGQ